MQTAVLLIYKINDYKYLKAFIIIIRLYINEMVVCDSTNRL